MGRLALVGGSSIRGLEVDPERVELLQRHRGERYTLPHLIDHGANVRALVDRGCERVLAIGSVGGLHAGLPPGTLLCPDDFIALDAPPRSALAGEQAHRVPGFDADWRREVVGAFAAAGAELRDGGVYWQASGPRLETPAEIRLVAAHAEVIGMTIASECVAAGELGLAYAAVCVVANFANGVAPHELTLEEVRAGQRGHRAALHLALERVLPALTG